MKYKRLCNFKHNGIDFEHSGENITKDEAQIFSLNSKCLNKQADCEGLKCLYAGGDCDPFFDFANPVHSDFLMHWTGRDIDDKHDPNWEKRNDPKLNQDIIEPYINRLRNILEYGLWMTSSVSDQPLLYKGISIRRPLFYRTCFSELKLSDTRVHAKRFGRLGIGVKRPFVMAKHGAPIVYFREEFENWFFASFKMSKKNKIIIPYHAWWAYYLKSMNEGSPNGGYLQYANFQESEWRIIYSNRISKKFGKIDGIDSVDEKSDKKFRLYLKKYSIPKLKQPQYLLPLNKWLAIIIYPSLAVKVRAESDIRIRRLMKKIKPIAPKNFYVNGSAGWENYSKPFGINLDACRNF